MSNEKIEESFEIISNRQDIKKCEEYERRILDGENILQEATNFSVKKVIDISEKSPEFLIINNVVPNYGAVTKQSTLNSLNIAKKIINEQIAKELLNKDKYSKN